MGAELTDERLIPEAPYYVVMRDTFLSDWGKAENRDAVFIAPCNSKDEARIVMANARSRGDQDEISLVEKKPMIHREVRYGLMTKEDSPRWYKEGGFSDD